jgi:predicted nucleic acid-binding protein
MYWTDYALGEIRRIPEKPTPRRLGITPDKIEALVNQLFPIAQLVDTPPSVFVHPIDPKDSHYVDLAVFTASKLIVSSDKHLLNLMKPDRPDGADFLARFPEIRVLQPWELVEVMNRS